MAKQKNPYIVSGIIGGAFFIVFFIIIDIPFLFSLFIALASFGGSSLILKGSGKKRGIIIPGKVSNQNLQKALQSGYNKLKEIKKFNPQVRSKYVSHTLNEIENIIEKILIEIKRDPDDLRRAEEFLDYYLDSTIKILSKYVELTTHDIKDADIEKSLLRVEEMLDSLKIAYSKQFTRLLNNDINSLDVELNMLESMLKAEGLTNN